MQPITKKCSKCSEYKEPTEFYAHGKTKQGKPRKSHRCKKCDNTRVNIAQKSRIPTKSRLPKKIYHGQISSSKKRGHELPKYTLSELREWMLSQDIYHQLFNEWAASNYSKDKVPSCDRIDDYKGYSLDNIRLVTWAENDRKHHENRIAGVNNKTNKAIKQYSMSGEFIKEFYSVRQAYRETLINPASISGCRTGRIKSAGGFLWKD